MFVVLSACLIASPATCKEDRIQQSVEERSPQACLIQGQSTVAEWGASHPQWHIVKWMCVPRSRLSTDL